VNRPTSEIADDLEAALPLLEDALAEYKETGGGDVLADVPSLIRETIARLRE